MGIATIPADNFVIIPRPTQNAIFRIFLSVWFRYHCSVHKIAPRIKTTESTSLLMLPENKINAG